MRTNEPRKVEGAERNGCQVCEYQGKFYLWRNPHCKPTVEDTKYWTASSVEGAYFEAS